MFAAEWETKHVSTGSGISKFFSSSDDELIAAYGTTTEAAVGRSAGRALAAEALAGVGKVLPYTIVFDPHPPGLSAGEFDMNTLHASGTDFAFLGSAPFDTTPPAGAYVPDLLNPNGMPIDIHKGMTTFAPSESFIANGIQRALGTGCSGACRGGH